MTPHLLLALALSTLIGLSLGLLGGGGSILAVPVLVYVARVDVHAAIARGSAVGWLAWAAALRLPAQGRAFVRHGSTRSPLDLRGRTGSALSHAAGS